MSQITWLALGYNVPANPSKNRVYVWRKLKEIGACYFRPGVALLPKSSQTVSQFGALGAKIREMGGEAALADLRFIEHRDEQRTVRMFKDQSRDDYLALIRDSRAVVEKLGGSILADGGADLIRRVTRSYKKVKSRDYFKCGPGAEMAEFLDELTGDISHGTSELARQLRLLID